MHKKNDVKVVVSGRKLTLRLTLGGLAKIEETTGENALQPLFLQKITAAHLLVIVTVFANTASEEITLEELGELAGPGDLITLAEAVADLYGKTMPQKEESDGKEGDGAGDGEGGNGGPS